jgi:hypothetical protein
MVFYYLLATNHPKYKPDSQRDESEQSKPLTGA